MRRRIVSPGFVILGHRLPTKTDRISELNVFLYARALPARIPASTPLVIGAVNPAFCLSELLHSVDCSQFEELEKTARTPEEWSNPTKLDEADVVKAVKSAYIYPTMMLKSLAFG